MTTTCRRAPASLAERGGGKDAARRRRIHRRARCASRADDDDKKISTQRKEIYIKISFEFKKITGKGSSRANYRPTSSYLSSSFSSSSHKKRTFIGAAGIFAPLKDDDLFADDEDGARIVASGWTVSVEDNILYTVILLCVLVFG